MTDEPKILITGATGQVGKGVIPYLTADPSVEIIAAGRSPKKAAHLGIPVVYLDLDQVDTMAPALKGIDRLFVVTGYTIDMLRQSKDLLNAAKASRGKARRPSRRLWELGAALTDAGIGWFHRRLWGWR